MKTIYLKAEIEDDTPTDQAVICLNDYDWSEVYLPTAKQIDNRFPTYDEVPKENMYRAEGANWLLNRIKAQ